MSNDSEQLQADLHLHFSKGHYNRLSRFDVAIEAEFMRRRNALYNAMKTLKHQTVSSGKFSDFKLPVQQVLESAGVNMEDNDLIQLLFSKFDFYPRFFKPSFFLTWQNQHGSIDCIKFEPFYHYVNLDRLLVVSAYRNGVANPNEDPEVLYEPFGTNGYEQSNEGAKSFCQSVMDKPRFEQLAIIDDLFRFTKHNKH